MSNLSDHFSVEEFERSDTAIRNRIPNKMGPKAKMSATALCRNVLERIRQYYGRPVIITSGYRSPRTNAVVGGSATSQHCRGEAADINVLGVTQSTLFNDIKSGKVGVEYDQLIDEFGSWVHISYRAGHNRKQALKARTVRGKVVYTNV